MSEENPYLREIETPSGRLWNSTDPDVRKAVAWFEQSKTALSDALWAKGTDSWRVHPMFITDPALKREATTQVWNQVVGALESQHIALQHGLPVQRSSNWFKYSVAEKAALTTLIKRAIYPQIESMGEERYIETLHHYAMSELKQIDSNLDQQVQNVALLNLHLNALCTSYPDFPVYPGEVEAKAAKLNKEIEADGPCASMARELLAANAALKTQTQSLVDTLNQMAGKDILSPTDETKRHAGRG